MNNEEEEETVCMKCSDTARNGSSWIKLGVGKGLNQLISP